jgi:hypothetical protein
MILNMNNQNHHKVLNRYGKARGVLMAYKYHLPTFSDMFLIHNEKEWLNLYSKVPSYITFRADIKLGNQNTKFLPRGESGDKNLVKEYINKVKKIDDEAVVIILINNNFCNRYDMNGGFNISFFYNKEIIVDFVGKGFDGGEITRGVDVHETWVIPFDDAIFFDEKNFNRYRIEINRDYSLSRNRRIAFLSSLGENKKLMEKAIPINYEGMKPELMKIICQQIIYPLLSIAEKMGHFCVPGNVHSDNSLTVFEIWKSERTAGYVENKK